MKLTKAQKEKLNPSVEALREKCQELIENEIGDALDDLVNDLRDAGYNGEEATEDEIEAILGYVGFKVLR